MNQISSRILLAVTAAVLVATAVPSFAQQVPSSAEPSRVQNQISPAPYKSPLVSGEGVVSGGMAEAPAGADKVKLELKSLHIEGATAYSDKELEKVYKDQLGKTITLADVYGIARALTVKYRNDGYILTQVVVPEQTIAGGNVRLRVVEGFVDKVTVQGETRSGNLAFIDGFAQKIRNSRPLNAKKLERYVLLLNDLPGITAKAVLSPSKTPGASDVAIVVEQKPYDLFAQVDNRGSQYLGPLQFNVGGRLNNALGYYEGISLQGVTAPAGFPDEDEMDYGAVSWAQPLNHEGTKLTAGLSITSTEPGSTLEQFDVHGVARSASLEVSHPFVRSRNLNLTSAVKFYYLNANRSDNFSAAPTRDHLRVLRASNTLQFTDSLVGINTISGELSKGLNILDASEKRDPNMTRPDADPQFFKGTLEISRLQRLSDMFELFLSAVGQKSANTLLASEEFGVGGLNYGSAYDNSEITGEDGVAERAELRANNPFATPFDLLQVYGFYDNGQVWDRDNANPRAKTRSLADGGAGFRANFNENFAGTFEVAVPLTRAVATTGDNDPRLFGSLTARF